MAKHSFFEIKYSNRKTELYAPKWDELGNDVVEVDAREFINNKHECSIPEFKLIYSEGECFIKSYSRTDYENTIAIRKMEWKRQDKLNYKIQWERLDWFWNKLYLFIHNECALNDVLESYKSVGYENIECCWHIVSKMSCIKSLKSLFRDITNNVTNDFLKLSIETIINSISVRYGITIMFNIIPYIQNFRELGYGITYRIRNTFDSNIIYDYDFKWKELKWTILPSTIISYSKALNRNLEKNAKNTLIKSEIEKSKFEHKDRTELRNLYRDEINAKALANKNNRICSIFKRFILAKTNVEIKCISENNKLYVLDKKENKLPLSFDIYSSHINDFLSVCKDAIFIIKQLDFTLDTTLIEWSSLTEISKLLKINHGAAYINRVLRGNGVFNPKTYKISLSSEYEWMEKYNIFSIDRYYYGLGYNYTYSWSSVGAMWLSKNFNAMKKIFQLKMKKVKQVKEQLQTICAEYTHFTIKEGNMFNYHISLTAKNCNNYCELFKLNDSNFTFEVGDDYVGDILSFDFEIAKTHMKNILLFFIKDCEKYGLRFFRESEVLNDK